MDTNTIHWHELEAALQRYVLRSFEAAADEAEELARVGVLARDIGEDAFRDADAEELDRRASGLRGSALHALAIALEIATQAGRLAALADVRRAKESAVDAPDK